MQPLKLNRCYCRLILLSVVIAAVSNLCQAGLLDFARSTKLVDESKGSYGSSEKLAKLVCTHQKDLKLIGRVSTIKDLGKFFDRLPASAADFAECKNKYGASIKSLSNIVSISNDNVCSDEKINAIEDFHKRFISTLKEDTVNRQPADGQAPRMVMNFFSHYVAQISKMCKESIVATLDKDVKSKFSKDDYAIGTGADFTGKLTHVMGSFFNAVHHYEDLLLLWELVDNNSKEDNKSMIVDTVDESTGESVKLLVVTKTIRPLLMAQQKCRQKFRPVYGKIIMPVSRLANLGYSFTDYQMEMDEEKLLANNEIVELWYRLTQFCESILPIQFLQDETIDEKATAIITLGEREKYLPQTKAIVKDVPPMEPYEYKPPIGLNTLPDDEDKLRTLAAIDGDLSVRKINTDSSARSRNARQFIARSIRGLKKLYTGNLKFSRQVAKSLGVTSDSNNGGNDQLKGDFVIADIKGLLSKSSTKTELSKIEGADEDGGEGKGVQRRSKRNVMYIVIGLCIAAVVLAALVPLILLAVGVFGG